MRVRVVAESVMEAVALWLNLAPVPVAESLWGPPASAILVSGLRTGIIPAIVRRPRTAGQLASELGLAAAPTRLLLDCLVEQRHARVSNGRYQLTDRARKWLDPASKTYVGGFIASHQDYWEWWSGLPAVVTSGKHFEMHDLPGDAPYWKPYITGQFELARLSAPEVAKAVTFESAPKKLLDVGGAHGWFSAELCRRYPGLSATVVDLPGSARVGRTIVADERMGNRVTHVEGNALDTEFGGPYDAALCFNLIHHLSPKQILVLFQKIRRALRLGATFAVLDLFRDENAGRMKGAAMLGLFFYLQSGSETFTPAQLQGWLTQAGFSTPRRVKMRTIPVQTLYECRAL